MRLLLLQLVILGTLFIGPCLKYLVNLTTPTCLPPPCLPPPRLPAEIGENEGNDSWRFSPKKIDLRSNEIYDIKASDFSKYPQLEILMLSDNKLVNLTNDALQSVLDLKYLYLHKNRIEIIDVDFFLGLDKLKQLYLQYNNLEHFTPGTFSNLPSLERLFLHGNKLKVIGFGSFKNLPSLQRLRLDNNSIVCDCVMMDFLDTMKEDVIDFEKLQIAGTCHSPDHVANKTITAVNKRELSCVEIKIIEGPQDGDIMSDFIHFKCRAIGEPKPTITWFRDNVPLELPDKRFKVDNEGTLHIIDATYVDFGSYYCLAKNFKEEVKSNEAVINGPPLIPIPGTFKVPTGPMIITQPKDVYALEGTTVSFECSAYGDPTPYITWFKDRKKVVQTDSIIVSGDGLLEIKNVSTKDEGRYLCEARNFKGSVSATGLLTIHVKPELHVKELPRPIKVGDNIALRCYETREPISKIRWFRNGLPINPSPRVTNPDGGILIIQSLKKSDAGEYICKGHNSVGRSEISYNLVIDQTNDVPPALIYKPFNVESLEGSTIEMPCKATGEPAPTITWSKDGSNLVLNERFKISPKGSLYISNTTSADSGRYECSATNINGRATASGYLSVTASTDTVTKPGDKYVRIAFAEATKDVNKAIQNTVDMLFHNNGSVQNMGELYRLIRFPNAPARELARANEVYERTLTIIRKYVSQGKQINVSSDFNYEEILSPTHIQLVAKLSGCISHRNYPNCSNTCFHWLYRSADGTCNNFENPTWGSSNTGFQRLLQPIYENSFNLPVGWNKDKRYNGFNLPNAREISQKLISTHKITEDSVISHMVMQWGQFLDHDLDHATPSVSSQSWDGIDCKRSCAYEAPCFPMEVPENDVRIHNRKCMDFTRSSAVCGSGITSIFFGTLQPREQINQLTSFIDASQVYGFSNDVAQELRELFPNKGKMRVGPTFPKKKALLPYSGGKHKMDCRKGALEDNIKCFMAGDIRANEQVGLLAMHTIWMREHNRLAEELAKINPHWSGDKIYHESRKIVGATMQHITYKHWLPVILGPSGMEKLDEYKQYDPYVNPTIANVFATAALRFGHSLINPVLKRLDNNLNEIAEGHLPLHKAFFSSWRVVEEGGVDPLLRGLLDSPAKLKTPTQNLNSDLTEKLFHVAHAVALDLAAMNIQRSRDHAIPFYVDWREYCNMPKVNDFDDLKNEITDPEVREKLKTLYGSVKNIDVWVGGILEDQLPGAKVGPLFQCLLIDQFRKLRDGDRFWYENVNVFTPSQLKEIKNTTLSRILCDNGDNIEKVTKDAFRLPNVQGGYVSCKSIQKINLKAWKDCVDCDEEVCKTETQDFTPKRLDDQYQNDGSCNNVVEEFNTHVQSLQNTMNALMKAWKLKKDEYLYDDN